MKKMIIIGIVFLFLLGCDTPPKDKPHPSGLDSCERFSHYFPSCWCDYSDGEAIIYKTGSTFNETYDVEAFVGRYYFNNVVLPNNGTMKEIECYSMSAGGFINCFLDGEYYTTYSDGDMFKTICGV